MPPPPIIGSTPTLPSQDVIAGSACTGERDAEGAVEVVLDNHGLRVAAARDGEVAAQPVEREIDGRIVLVRHRQIPDASAYDRRRAGDEEATGGGYLRAPDGRKSARRPERAVPQHAVRVGDRGRAGIGEANDERVVVRASDQRVVAGATVDHVIARAAVHDVIAAADKDQVVATAAIDRVGLRRLVAGDDEVMAAQTVDRDARGGPAQRVAREHVIVLGQQEGRHHVEVHGRRVGSGAVIVLHCVGEAIRAHVIGRRRVGDGTRGRVDARRAMGGTVITVTVVGSSVPSTSVSLLRTVIALPSSSA